MDFNWIVPVLALGTLLAVAVLAMVAKGQIDARRARRTPKSSLAKDGPDGGLPPANP